MAPISRASLLLTIALTGLGASACSGDEPLGCSPDAIQTLEGSALTDMLDVRLHRVTGGFVLVGHEGDAVRWNGITDAGVIDKTKEASLTLPGNRAVGPWFAVLGKKAPGDQLAVVYGLKRPPKMPGLGEYIELQVITQEIGMPATAPKPLLDLPAVPDADKSLRFTMGTAASGRRAGLAWGFEGQRALPKFVTLKPDGELNGMPADITQAAQMGMRWDCLAFVSSRAELGVSTVERGSVMGDKVSWNISEFREDGGHQGSVRLSLDVTDMDCPTVAPTSKGYTISWQNMDGTYFADYIEDKKAVNKDIVKGAVRFGGPQKQPRVACLAPVGNDFAITYEFKTGPQVDRFDVFGNPRGATLHLPIDGAPGPVSGWPALNHFFVTYLDQPIASGTTSKPKKRLFVKVSCGAQL
jgi:hypothetical protein